MRSDVWSMRLLRRHVSIVRDRTQVMQNASTTDKNCPISPGLLKILVPVVWKLFSTLSLLNKTKKPNSLQHRPGPLASRRNRRKKPYIPLLSSSTSSINLLKQGNARKHDLASSILSAKMPSIKNVCTYTVPIQIVSTELKEIGTNMKAQSPW